MAETPPVTPTIPTTPVSVSPNTSSALTGLLVSKSPSVPQQAQQQTQTTEGRVVSSNPQTQELRIQTSQGEIVLRTPLRLAPDTVINLRFYMDRGQMKADITLMRASATQADATAKIIQPTAPQPQTPPPAMRVGQNVQALMLPPIPASTPIGAGAALLPAAGAMTANISPGILHQILSAYQPRGADTKTAPITPDSAEADAPEDEIPRLMGALPTSKPGKTDGKTPTIFFPSYDPILAAMQNPDADINETQKPMPLPRSLTDLAEIPRRLQDMTILKILPMGGTQEQIAEALKSLGAKTAQTAKVETVTPNGYPVLKAETGIYILQEPAEVKTGSIVLFTAKPVASPEAAAKLAEGIAQDFDPAIGTNWPALDEALETLRQTSPAIAQALARSLPHLSPQQMPAATLFFMAAMRLGAVENWLGDNTLKALRAAGKTALISRLGGDFSKLSVQSQDSLQGEWKSFSLPLLHEDQISRMQLFVRHQPDRDGGEDGKAGKTGETRFILNLQLSRMGDMQMDGFLRKKSFDMILRTEDKLPASMRHEITQHFARGIEHVNMQGGISFQAKRQGWVTVESPTEQPSVVA